MDKENLMQAGVDYDQGVRRFAGKLEIYEKFLVKFFNGNLMDNLKQQLDEKDYQSAFKTAHDLKGTSGNLSINLFYAKICELVEILRNEAQRGDLQTSYSQAKELYDRAERGVRS